MRTYETISYQKLSQRWRDIVKAIRSTPGFNTFLLPTPFEALSYAAVAGPVILINISNYRSDAVIISSAQPPIAVPLPGTTLDALKTLVQLLRATAIDRAVEGNIRKEQITQVLRDLWDLIVEPVIGQLEEVIRLPARSRIWWCPTGITWSLPLHAAGPYTMGVRNLPDRYVSSYTPSLQALIRSRADSICPHPTQAPTMLVVGQSNAPGETDELPNVKHELELIKNHIQNAKVLDGKEATRVTVLTALRDHSWAHFTCHGHQNSFRSSFSLYDGPLELLDIMKGGLPNAELAFLGACHSHWLLIAMM